MLFHCESECSAPVQYMTDMFECRKCPFTCALWHLMNGTDASTNVARLKQTSELTIDSKRRRKTYLKLFCKLLKQAHAVEPFTRRAYLYSSSHLRHECLQPLS